MVRRASPGELDLQLALVVCELDLDLQVDPRRPRARYCVDPRDRTQQRCSGQGCRQGHGAEPQPPRDEGAGFHLLQQLHVISSGCAFEAALEPYSPRAHRRSLWRGDRQAGRASPPAAQQTGLSLLSATHRSGPDPRPVWALRSTTSALSTGLPTCVVVGGVRATRT